MKNLLSKKLSLMVFLHFFAFGSIIPIISLYLMKDLQFSGSQVGMILAVGAISSIISPLISSFVADRLICSERLFAIGHFMGSIVMLFLFFSTKFQSVLIGYLFYNAFVGPTMPLGDAIIFHHISDRKKYGSIRVWGTIGWITVALFFGLFIMQKSGSFRYVLLLSSITSLSLSIFAFSIPKTDVDRKNDAKFIPVDSIKVLMKPEILILTIITFLIFFGDRFYFYGSSPYLKSVGFQEKYILPFLSIGQFLEIFAMLSLGFLMTKFRAKIILLAGISVNILRYSLLMIFHSKVMAIVAVAFHGLAYTLIFSTIFIFIDYRSSKKSRAGVHQLFRIIYLGFGTFLGNLTAGYVQDNFNSANDYNTFWLIPTIISTMVFFMMLFFPEKKNLHTT